MEIVRRSTPLGRRRARRTSDELAQLLLDAHASNMALGLAAPLTRERAAAEWRPLDRAVLSRRIEDGVVVGAVRARAD